MDGDVTIKSSSNTTSNQIKPSSSSSSSSTLQDVEEMELPEDRFHRKDAASSYLISQREQAKQDKWDKHEK